MAKAINFFASPNDISSVLAELESKVSVHYCKSGMSETPNIPQYDSFMCIPNLGRADTPNDALCTHYLMAYRELSFDIEKVPQRRGGIMYSVDQGNNPDTVELSPGGLFDEHSIISGRFATGTNSLKSVTLIKATEKIVRRRWKQIQSYKVGPKAERMLDEGARLTSSINAPREYDLRRPQAKKS